MPLDKYLVVSPPFNLPMPTNFPEFNLPPGPLYALKIARHAQELLRRTFDPNHVVPYTDLSLQIKSECQQIAHTVYKARHFMHEVPWDVKKYESSVEETGDRPLWDPDQEEDRSEDFPRIGSISRKGEAPVPISLRQPATFVDEEGVILWWYLPGIIQNSRLDTIASAVKVLGAADQTPLKMYPDGDWKSHPGLFDAQARSYLRSGLASFSPATFFNHLDHADRPLWPTWLPRNMATCSPTFDNPQSGADVFIQSMSESLAVLSAVLACTYPRLFDAGMQVIESIHVQRLFVDHPVSCQQVLQSWSTPFTNIDLAVNRETPIHRDLDFSPSTYTSLLAAGYFRSSVMSLPGIAAQLDWSPGTMAMGLTSLIPYGISSVSPLHCNSILLSSGFDIQVLKLGSTMVPQSPSLYQMWDFDYKHPNANVGPKGKKFYSDWTGFRYDTH
ncbi:hypothetical protein BKA70DRAFT_1429759 [Coprinopsis sp. MPI-PUGE-AT-0042]|nr:hypothetical protein BKA70DRAFT_1429759 [Coprinopsis sp. MPI-PUGE-AT-0042]